MKSSEITDWGAEIVKPALPEDIRDKLEEMTAPGKRGSILVLKLASAATKFETRRNMFAVVKAINASKLTIRAQGEEFHLWSGLSKPAFLRQQDQLVTEALNILRKIADPERLDFDYPKQRLFLDDRLVAFRPVNAES